ncbi:MAG: MerR family transcriptional regulator [Desulfosalsimonadaceae bacterium]
MHPNPETEPNIPDKLYFKIGEVTDITGLAGYILRFWESEFTSIRPGRSESGQRLYRKKDIEEILKIKHLLYVKKFTIQGAKKHLKSRNPQSSPTRTHPTIEEIRRELKTIRDLLE